MLFKHRLFGRLLAVSCVIFAQATMIRSAFADEEFSNETLNGNYGFVANGYNGATTTPWVRAGVLTFDGDGNCSLAIGLTKNGFGPALNDPNPPCTYDVENNGSVTISVGGVPRTFLVIVNHGKELMFIRTSPESLNVSGIAKKQ